MRMLARPCPALVAAAMLGGCAAAPESPEPAATPWQLCEAAPDPSACHVALERSLIEQNPLVSRPDSSTLVIRATSGDSAVFADAHNDDTWRFHHYLGYVAPLGSHLVQVGLFEGRRLLLIDAGSLARTALIGEPVVSPAALRFATTSANLEANYDPNGLEVWRVTESGPVLEWSVLGGTTWAAEQPSWENDDRLRFVRVSFDARSGARTREPMVLELGDSEMSIRRARR